MIVSDKPELEALFNQALSNQDALIVSYQHPLKALDNMDEVMPDIVIWDHEDFPRHWKIAATWRNGNARLSNTKIVIVCSTPMSQEESEKLDAFDNLEVIEEGFESERLVALLLSQTEHGDLPKKHSASEVLPLTSGHLSFLDTKVGEIILCQIEASNDHLVIAKPLGLSTNFEQFPGQFYSQALLSSSTGVSKTSLKCIELDEEFRLKFLLV